MMDKSLEVQLHLQGAVPGFKGKHGAPVQPEGGTEYFVIEDIFDLLVVEVLIPGEEQLHDLHAAFLAQVELAVCMGILSAVFRCAAEGIVRVMLVQPVILVQYGSSRYLQRRNTVEQIPQALEMVFHLTAATHNIAAERIFNAVACAARNVHGLQNVNVLALHLSVAD